MYAKVINNIERSSLMNINSVSYRNEQNYRQTPTFGAIRFTDSAMQVLKSQIINRVGNNVDSFVKEVKPLIARSEKNPIHVIVDGKLESTKLFARVEDRKLNFGYDATTTYSQDDRYTFDFLAKAVDKAEDLSKLNKELDELQKNSNK